MRTCTITEKKIAAIARKARCTIYEAIEILDPQFTYWSQCGDCSKDEHFDYLETASVSEIARWLSSIIRDIQSEQQNYQGEATNS